MTRIELMKEIDQYIEDHKDTFYNFDPETGFDESGNVVSHEKTVEQEPGEAVKGKECSSVDLIDRLMAGVKSGTSGRTKAMFELLIERREGNFKKWMETAKQVYGEFAPAGAMVSIGYMKKVVQKFAKTGVIAEWDGKASTPINWLI